MSSPTTRSARSHHKYGPHTKLTNINGHVISAVTTSMDHTQNSPISSPTMWLVHSHHKSGPHTKLTDVITYHAISAHSHHKYGPHTKLTNITTDCAISAQSPQAWLVCWYSEPSQQQRITSGLKQTSNCPIYSVHKSSKHKFSKNHKISPDTNLHKTIHTQRSYTKFSKSQSLWYCPC